MTDVVNDQTPMYRGRPRPRPRNAALSKRYQQLLDGVITIDDLDDEEIARGQLRNSRGAFAGAPPRVIPWAMHDALRASMTRRIERKLIEKLPQTVDSLVKIANSPNLNPEARVKAITLIMDRALGKVPDKSESSVTVTSKWEEAAAGGRIFVDLDAEPLTGEPDIVDAEVVEGLPEIEPVRKKPRPRTGVQL